MTALIIPLPSLPPKSSVVHRDLNPIQSVWGNRGVRS